MLRGTRRGENVRAHSSDSRTLAPADRSADRSAGLDPAPSAHAVGLLLRPWSVVARHLEIPLPGLPGAARHRRRLVHAALHLHVAVPLAARAGHTDDDADVEGRRLRHLAVLGGDVSVRGGRARMW